MVVSTFGIFLFKMDSAANGNGIKEDRRQNNKLDDKPGGNIGGKSGRGRVK